MRNIPTRNRERRNKVSGHAHVGVMVAMIVYTVQQEMKLRNSRTRMLENSAQIKQKEEAIAEVKKKIGELKSTLTTVNTKINELKTEKAGVDKLTGEFDKSLQTCNSEKKLGIAEAITKLKEAKRKVEKDIQGLKQQILDRDKAICAFVDTTKEEARKLCAISEALK
uniref:Si:dkey-87o1.2 n=1 Tax=Mastacembelus armatus TaxID=205130 RepID=A0A7N9AN68_9TELE